MEAPTWVALNGKWAVPGDNYGQSILDLYKRMLESTLQSLQEILRNIEG